MKKSDEFGHKTIKSCFPSMPCSGKYVIFLFSILFSATTAGDVTSVERSPLALKQLDLNKNTSILLTSDFQKEIVDELASLENEAIRHLANAEYTETKATIGEALMIARSYFGLYSIQQLRLIEILIENHIQRLDWSSISASYKLLEDILANNSEIMKETKIVHYLSIAKWRLAASKLDATIAPYQHLKQGITSIDKASTLQSSIEPKNSRKLVRMLWLKAALAYATENHFATWTGDPIFGKVQDAIFTVGDVDVSDLMFRKNLLIAYQLMTKETLDQALLGTGHPGNDDLRAHSHKLLGDWYVLHSRKKKAELSYAKASEIAAKTLDVNLFTNSPLPDFFDYLKKTYLKEKLIQPAISECIVDLNGLGKVRKITASVSNHDRSYPKCSLLRNMIFRPTFKHGELIDTKQVKIKITAGLNNQSIYIIEVDGTKFLKSNPKS